MYNLDVRSGISFADDDLAGTQMYLVNTIASDTKCLIKIVLLMHILASNRNYNIPLFDI